jgi:hypothetical protein
MARGLDTCSSQRNGSSLVAAGAAVRDCARAVLPTGTTSSAMSSVTSANDPERNQARNQARDQARDRSWNFMILMG